MNGTGGSADALPAYDREDLIRIINQSLRALGFQNVADQLQQESQIALESEEVVAFRQAVLDGQWDTACKLLASFQQSLQPEEQRSVSALLFREKFLEQLAAGDVRGALACLRTQLQPVLSDRALLHRLGQAVIARDASVLRDLFVWGGAPENRQHLLRTLEQGPCSRFLLPAHRLDRLLRQALQAQRNACLYHNLDTPTMSLLYDHQCHRSVIPQAIVATLAQHDDEVWFLQFSHSGRQLASCSKDGRCIIWDVHSRACLHVLAGHINEVEYCDWSPDDRRLLTCGSRADKSIVVWCTQTGSQLRRLAFHENGITALAWTPSGDHFLSASIDQRLVLWCSKTYTLLHTWTPMRISSMAVTCTGRLVAVCHEHKIRVFDLATREQLMIKPESSSVTSVCVSRDGKEALVGLLNGELHLWSIDKDLVALRKFAGHTNGHYVLRACFGGVGEDFIVCGSEDGCIHIWHRASGKLLDTLDGHAGSVNAVAWSPLDHTLMASAGDDAEVHLWGPAGSGSRGSASHAAIGHVEDGMISSSDSKKRHHSP